MATFLDVTGLQHFSNFFVFIFVWLVIYAVLGATKILGDNKGIHIILGLVIGLLVLVSPVTAGAIAFVSPWFAMVFIFLILILLSLKTLGVSDADMASLPQLKVGLITALVVIMVIGVVTYVRDNTEMAEGEEVDYSKASSVILHPKVLGVLFVLLIAVFTILLMAGKTT